MALEALNALPWSTYLMLIDIAVRTGCVPKLNQRNEPTGEFDTLDGEQRLRLIEAWGRKLIPDAPKEVNHTIDSAGDLAAQPAIAAGMKLDDLRRLAMPATYEVTRIEADADE